MRIAGHTMATPDLALADALALFARLGLDGAEIIWQDGYACGLPERGDGRELATVRAQTDELGLEVVCLAPYVSKINSLDARERADALDSFRRCIEAAGRLGCPRIRVYAGRFVASEQAERGRKRERLVASLEVMQEWAIAGGVTLCVENHFNTMAVSAAQTAELLADVAERSGTDVGLGALYDPANLTFTHDEPALRALELQKCWVSHVHVKDLVFTDRELPFTARDVATVDDDARAVRSRVVGDGILDWSAIVCGLAEQGYDGYLSLEYEYRWHPDDLPPPEVGLREGAARLRSLLNAACGTGDV